MSCAPKTVFTVGHSTRSIEVFIALMRSFSVQVVVDIRTVPRSRTNLQFNLDVLPVRLKHEGMDGLLVEYPG